MMKQANPDASGFFSILPPLLICRTFCQATGIVTPRAFAARAISLDVAGLAKLLGERRLRVRNIDRDRARSGARGGLGLARCRTQACASSARMRVICSGENPGSAGPKRRSRF